MADRDPREQLEEQVALYVAGALPPRQMAALEARLLAQEADVVDAFEALGGVADALATQTPEIAPPPAVKEGLMARVGHFTRKLPDDATETPEVVRADEAGWEPSGTPGVQVKILKRGPGGDPMTFLARMAPGAIYPGHPHPMVEECVVLEGDFQSHGESFGPGDYLRFPAASRHGDTTTEGGCVLLLTYVAA